MTGPELWINPRLLLSLSASHSEAAAEASNLASITRDTAAAILRTHGVICSSTSTAAELAAAARENACIAIQTMSEAHAHNLKTAAAKYDTTDADESGRIHRQMPHR